MKLKKFKIYVSVDIIAILCLVIMQSVYMISYGKSEQESIEKRRNYIESQPVNLSREERDTLNLINEYRKQNGLKELKVYSSLQEVAKLKAEDLVSNNYFAHDSDSLGTPFQMLASNNIEYKIAGENLAGNSSPENAVQAWINSNDHRANILEENYEYTGLCVIDSEIYKKIYVQIFIGI